MCYFDISNNNVIHDNNNVLYEPIITVMQHKKQCNMTVITMLYDMIITVIQHKKLIYDSNNNVL